MSKKKSVGFSYPNSKLLTLIIFSILMTFGIGAKSVVAANCGGTTACNCGDNLNASRTLNASDNLINCPANGLLIGSNNIVLDCSGQIMNGSDTESGIHFPSSYNNVTIKNCMVYNFAVGINLHDSSHVNVINNTFYSDYISSTGVYLWNMNNATLTNNNISYNYIGIEIWNSNNSVINYNKIYDSISYDLRHNSGSNNDATLNYWGANICGARFSGITNNNVTPYYTDFAMTTLDYGPNICPAITVTYSPTAILGLAENFTVNIIDINSSKYIIYENGNVMGSGSYSNGVSFNVPVNTTQAGVVNYMIWANNTLGNNASTSINISVLMPPTVAAMMPANGQTWLSSNTTFVFYAMSIYNSTLGYNLTLDGVVNQTGTAVSGANTSVTITGLSDGNHTWNVTVWDTSSNHNTSQTATFAILTEVAVESVLLAPIVNATNSSGIIDLASKGVPASIIDETGVIGYEYVVTTNGSTPVVNLSVQIFIEAPTNVTDVSSLSNTIAGFYYTIIVNDSNWYANVTNIQLRIYYNISTITLPSGILESSLRPVRYTNGTWVRLDCDALGGCTTTLADGTKLFAAGVDTTNSYVWANLSKFSIYGLGGAAITTTTGGGGGGSNGGAIAGEISQLTTQVAFSLEKNGYVQITHEGIKRQVNIYSIDSLNKKVTFRIQSVSRYVQIGEGQTANIDIDLDGTDDFSIYVSKIYANLVQIQFGPVATPITPEVKEAEKAPAKAPEEALETTPPAAPGQETVPPAEEKKEMKTDITAYVILAALVFTVSILLILRSRKKKEPTSE